MGAAAAEGDQAVAALFLVDSRGFIHVPGGGVGNGAVIYFIFHAVIIENIGDLLENAGFYDALVGDDERLLAAELFKTIRNGLGRVHADESGAGNEEGGNEGKIHFTFHIRTP